MHKDQYKILFRFLLWGGLIFLGVLRYFDVNPILMDQVPERLLTQEAPARSGGEVLIAVDSGRIAQSAQEGAFSQVDWSYAWINTIEQEIGPHTVLERAELRSADLARYRYVILTHSAAAHVADRDLVGHLRNYVRAGGVLVLERPSAALREAFSADGQGGQRRAGAITRVHQMAPRYADLLKQMPLETSYVGSSGPARGATTYLSMDETPVIYRRPEERGHVITVEFNYGLQLVAMQQGRPEEDFSVRNRYPEVLAPALESNDMAMDASLLDNPTPYADLLEKYLVHQVMGDARPVVALWPFADGKQGALLMTHDEEMMGNKADWMATWEQTRGATSSNFIIPNEFFTSKGARSILGAGGDVQLHWNRPQSGQGLFEPVGVWKINPFVRAHTLKQQVEDLNALLPRGRKVMANRNHYLLWGQEWTEPFQQMAAVGLSADSTYGPDKGCRGYLFGTGMPFWPMDVNGLPMPVQEFPLISAEDLGGVDQAWLFQRFRDSQLGYHQVINVLFHPNAYQWRPGTQLFDLWLSTYDMAEDTEHGFTTVRALHGFWRQRRQAAILSSVRLGKTPIPVIPQEPGKERKEKEEEDLLKPPEPEESKEPPPLLIVVEVNTKGKGHSISAPHRVGERVLSQAVRGKPSDLGSAGARPLSMTSSDILGQRVRLIPLREGYNNMTLIYR